MMWCAHRQYHASPDNDHFLILGNLYSAQFPFHPFVPLVAIHKPFFANWFILFTFPTMKFACTATIVRPALLKPVQNWLNGVLGLTAPVPVWHVSMAQMTRTSDLTRWWEQLPKARMGGVFVARMLFQKSAWSLTFLLVSASATLKKSCQTLNILEFDRAK